MLGFYAEGVGDSGGGGHVGNGGFTGNKSSGGDNFGIYREGGFGTTTIEFGV